MNCFHVGDIEDKGRNVGASGAVENYNKVFLVIIEHECNNCATLSQFLTLEKGTE